jgi:hypothetical protein
VLDLDEPKICRPERRMNPVLETGAAFLVASVRSRLRLHHAHSAFDP